MSIPIEPSGDMRHFAAMLRQLYLSMIEAGFSTGEAMEILATMLRSNFGAEK